MFFTSREQVQVLCGWSTFTEKCGGSASAADSRAAMAVKGGDVSSREILNGKLCSGLDALAGLVDEEKLNDNRDFNCLVLHFRIILLVNFAQTDACVPPEYSGRLGGCITFHDSRAHAFR